VGIEGGKGFQEGLPRRVRRALTCLEAAHEDRTSVRTRTVRGTWDGCVFCFTPEFRANVFHLLQGELGFPRPKTGGLWLMVMRWKVGHAAIPSTRSNRRAQVPRGLPTEPVIRWEEACFCFCGATARTANGRRASSARCCDGASVGWRRTTIVTAKIGGQQEEG